jgi:hypothetical protein
MDHLTHSALLWVVVGSAVLALFLWLVMLSSSAGRQHDAELDRLLSAPATEPATSADTESRIRSVADPAPEADRFRLLGDPEYGLFLDEADLQAAS